MHEEKKKPFADPTLILCWFSQPDIIVTSEGGEGNGDEDDGRLSGHRKEMYHA